MYTDICQPPFFVLSIGLAMWLADIAFQVAAANLYPQLTKSCYDDNGCTRKLIANGIFFIAANLVGWSYSFTSWNYTRKSYLNTRSLTESQRRFADAQAKAEQLALSILPKRVWEELSSGVHHRFNMDSLFHKSLMYKFCKRRKMLLFPSEEKKKILQVD